MIYVADSYITTLNKSCCQVSIGYPSFVDLIISFCKISGERIRCITVNRFDGQIPVLGKLQYSITQNRIHLYSNNIKSNCCGFQAMLMFSNFLIEKSEEEFTKELEIITVDLYNHLVGLGGPAITRFLYGNYLIKYCFTKFKLVEIGKDYIEISKMWSSCSKELYRSIVYYDLQYLEKAGNIVNEILVKEKNSFNKLEKLIERQS